MSEGGLLLIARSGDPLVPALQRLVPGRLLHADVQSLSQPGWQYVVGRPQDARAQVRGVEHGADRIAAVLCRLHQVEPADLPQLHAEDRAYAAIEMTAFLRAWLSQFPGRCCNRPSAVSLAGPAWHPVHARWLAAQQGVPVVAGPLAHDGRALERLASATPMVVGEHVLGASDDTMAAHALRLARATGCGLLELRFVHDQGWKLLWMQSCSPMDDRQAAALVEWTLGAAASAPAQGRTCDAAATGMAA